MSRFTRLIDTYQEEEDMHDDDLYDLDDLLGPRPGDTIHSGWVPMVGDTVEFIQRKYSTGNTYNQKLRYTVRQVDLNRGHTTIESANEHLFNVRIDTLKFVERDKKPQQEETHMSKYVNSNDRHDKIFEAMIHDLFKTVSIRFMGDRLSHYHYRAPIDMELETGDKVVVESRTGLSIAEVIQETEDRSDKASAWVIQKIDTSAHETRQEEWTLLYDGVKEAELAQQKEALAAGYEKQLLKYAPEAAKVLTGMKASNLLENKPAKKKRVGAKKK